MNRTIFDPTAREPCGRVKSGSVPVLFFFNTGVAIMSHTAPAEYDELMLHFITETKHGGSVDHRRSWWSADRPFGVVVHLGLAEGLVG